MYYTDYVAQIGSKIFNCSLRNALHSNVNVSSYHNYCKVLLLMPSSLGLVAIFVLEVLLLFVQLIIRNLEKCGQ